jgi:hypothetical protein
MNRLLLILSILTSILTSTLPTLVQAEIHKWVDEQGQVHYEDRPGSSGAFKSSTPAELVLSPEQERLQKQKRVLEAMQSERRNKQQAKDKAEEEHQDAVAKCQFAQRDLQTRQNARYLYRKGKDGERDVLSEDDRAKSTAEAEAAVKKWCK